MSITLAQLREKCFQRADLENSDFITTAEADGYINDSIAELYDLVVAAFENYYTIESTTSNTVAGQNAYDLPEDFYKLDGVDIKLNGTEWYSLRPFNFNERNRGGEVAGGLIGPTLRYRIVKNQLIFNPVPGGNYQYRIWYTPVSPTLVDDADTLNDLNRFSEYVVLDVAIKMLNKEESDVSVLLDAKNRQIRRIQDMAANRDAGQPASVSDIYSENDDDYYYRS